MIKKTKKKNSKKKKSRFRSGGGGGGGGGTLMIVGSFLSPHEDSGTKGLRKGGTWWVRLEEEEREEHIQIYQLLPPRVEETGKVIFLCFTNQQGNAGHEIRKQQGGLGTPHKFHFGGQKTKERR